MAYDEPRFNTPLDIKECERCSVQLTKLDSVAELCENCGYLYFRGMFIKELSMEEVRQCMTKTDADPVKNPSHYCISGYECSKVAEAIGLVENAYLFNIFKYIWRARHKGNEKQDLEKIIQYAKMRIAQLEKQNAIQES